MKLIPILFAALLVAWDAGAELPNELEYANRGVIFVDEVRVIIGASTYTHNIADTLRAYLGVDNASSDTLVIPNPGLITPMFRLHVLPADCDPEDLLSD